VYGSRVAPSALAFQSFITPTLSYVFCLALALG
jgi:hypothetical protein